MNVMESDLANRDFSGTSNPDALLSVTFYSKPIQNNFESTRQGRPIFADSDMVRIMTPGNQLNIIDTLAREEHKQRFPIQWARYQNKSGEQLVGTPVDQWPPLTRAQAEELKGLKFFTVEQIAGCSDEQAQRMGMMGPTLRKQAAAWLAKASDMSLVTAQAAELKKRDDELAAMKAEMAELRRLVQPTAKPAIVSASPTVPTAP